MDDSFYKYSWKTKSSVMQRFWEAPGWSTTTPMEVNLAQCQNERDAATTSSNFLFRMSHGLSFCKPWAAVNPWLNSYMTKGPHSLKLTKTWSKWSWYLTGRQQVRCSAVKEKFCCQSKGISMDVFIWMKGHFTCPQSWARKVDQNLSGLRFFSKTTFKTNNKHEEFS